MKKLFKKRQILLAGLVLVLAAAIYINWQFSGNGTDIMTASQADENLGDAEYVAAQNVGVTSSESENQYFISAREEREKTRNDSISELEQIENNVKSGENEIAAANAEHIRMAAAAETEANIESLVRAKGFADCIAVVSDSSVSVVVQSDALESAEILQIQDVVLSQREVPLENITVINVE